VAVRTFDAIVVGLGAHGSAAVLALTRRGLRVLGVERGERGHELGSSGGRSRMIRRAYFEHLAYIPLLVVARDGWDRLAEETGEAMVTTTGGLYIGSPGGELVAGSIASAREQGVPHEVVDADEIRRRWPAFTPDDAMIGLVDPGAGMIDPQRAIEAQLRLAERGGAELRFGERALDWRPADGGIEVETNAGVHSAGHLVIAAGAWTSSFVADLELPLAVERVPVFWFEPEGGPAGPAGDDLPVWIVETAFDGAFYGFPYSRATGLKVARHYSGEIVDPETVDRAEHPADVERVRAFGRHHMPVIADAPLTASMVCLYTNAPDLHFVLDTHPAVPHVAFASACSGHGFKFAPAIGEILADLALTGATSHPIDQFRASRFVG
jgi:sarcosine oxidase